MDMNTLIDASIITCCVLVLVLCSSCHSSDESMHSVQGSSITHEEMIRVLRELRLEFPASVTKVHMAMSSDGVAVTLFGCVIGGEATPRATTDGAWSILIDADRENMSRELRQPYVCAWWRPLPLEPNDVMVSRVSRETGIRVAGIVRTHPSSPKDCRFYFVINEKRSLLPESVISLIERSRNPTPDKFPAQDQKFEIQWP